MKSAQRPPCERGGLIRWSLRSLWLLVAISLATLAAGQIPARDPIPNPIHLGAPQVGAPPVAAPPVAAPPVAATPVGATPVGAPPVGAPPVGAPPVGALLVDAPKRPEGMLPVLPGPVPAPV